MYSNVLAALGLISMACVTLRQPLPSDRPRLKAPTPPNKSRVGNGCCSDCARNLYRDFLPLSRSLQHGVHTRSSCHEMSFLWLQDLTFNFGKLYRKKKWSYESAFQSSSVAYGI